MLGGVSGARGKHRQGLGTQLVEYFLRRPESQDPPRPGVELALDERQLLVGDAGQFHALGQVLADQAIGVLVGAALPGAIGVAEIDVHPQCFGELLVQGHLSAAVVGESLAHAARDRAQSSVEARQDTVRFGVVQFDQPHESRGSFHPTRL